MRKVILSVALLLAFSISTPALSATKAALSFTKGMLVFSDGEYNKALGYFKQGHKADPDKLDNTYFLALTHERLGDHKNAIRYFKELLEKDPAYEKAWHPYGLSLYDEGRYSEALVWLEKVYQKRKNPAVLVYVGLSHYQLNNKEAALNAFQKVKRQKENPKLSEAAAGWITKIEAGESISKAKQGVTPEKRFSMVTTVASYYDNNVTIDPDEEDLSDFQAEQDDGMTSGSLSIRYLLHKTENAKLFVDWSSYQTAYWNTRAPRVDLNLLNYGRHKGGIRFQYRLSDKVQWRLPIHYFFSTLGAAKYNHGGGGESAFDIAWNKNWLSIFTLGIKRIDYYASPSNIAQVRDTLQPIGRFEQYFFFPGNRQRYFRIGYETDINLAEGDDWDYTGHRILFTFHTPLFWKIKFLTLSTFVPFRRHQNTDSVLTLGGQPTRRDDFYYYGLGMLTRDWTPHFSTSLSYSFTLQDSNLIRFSYKRHMTGIIFTLRT